MNVLAQRNADSPWKLWLSVGALTLSAGVAMVFAVKEWGPWSAALLPLMMAAGLLIEHPEIGAYMMAAALPLGALVTLDGELPTLRVLGLVAAGAWLLYRLVSERNMAPRGGCKVLRAAFVLTFLAIASMAWSFYRADTQLALLTLGMSIVWLVVIRDLMNSWERVRRLSSYLVAAALVASTLTIKEYFFEGAARAGDGVTGGINDTAAMLAGILPFAVVLVGRENGLWMRLLGASSGAASLVAILLTFSRSSWLLVGVLALLYFARQILLSDRPRLALAATVLVLGVAVSSWQPARERLLSIGPVASEMLAGITNTDSIVNSRAYHVRVAWAMFRDSPIIGMGYGSYPRQFRYRYQFTVLGSERIYGSPRSPHNSYFGVLAELGIIGLGLWLICLGYGLLSAVVAWLTAVPARRPWVEAIGFSLVLYMVHGFAAPVHQNKFLWTLFGLGSAALALAQRDETHQPGTAIDTQTGLRLGQ